MQDVSILTIEQLKALVAACQKEIDSRSVSQKIRVTKKFGSYNEKRYGRPWIARVVRWKVGSSAELEFGSYLGDARNGGGGDAEVLAFVGDIVRWGQKDNRGSNTDAYWGVVDADGAIRVIDQAEARQLMTVK